MRNVLALATLALLAVSADAAPPSLDMPRPRFAARPSCVCSTACVCRPGVCPGGCPIAVSAPVGAMPGYDWRHVPGVGMAWVQKGVTFALPTATAVPTYYYPAMSAPPVARYTFAPTGGSCPGGQCPLPTRR